MGRGTSEPEIDHGSTHGLFTELVGRAVAEVQAEPSPLASAYLVELLGQFVRGPGPAARGEDGVPTLAEALLTAQRQRGAVRAAMLRELGDRVLFLSGFFSRSLRRGLVGERYYRDIGRAAYGGLAALLRPSRSGSALYGELAEGFPIFVAVLEEVGSLSRGETDEDLLALYEAFVHSASPRARAKLTRRGLVLPDDPSSWRPIQ